MDKRKEEMVKRLLGAGRLSGEQIAGALSIKVGEVENLREEKGEESETGGENILEGIRERYYDLAMTLEVKTGDAAVGALVKMLKLERDDGETEELGWILHEVIGMIVSEIARSKKLEKLNAGERQRIMGAVYDGVWKVTQEDWYARVIHESFKWRKESEL